MPQFILPLLAAIGITGATAVFIATVIEVTLLNIALTKLVQLFSRQPGAAPPPPINVTVQSTTEFRRIVLGQARCGGVYGFYRTSGSTNQFLWFVVMYAGHQCNAVLDAFLDTRQVPAADINPSTGAVATGAFNGKLSIWTHLGTSGQAVDAQLAAAFPGIFDANHRLAGICYRVFKLTRDDTAWPQGAPQNLNSVVQGALVYDPRKDSTFGGSGTHRKADATTWEYNDNAALNTRWYLSGGSVWNDVPTRKIMYGLKEVDSRIDDNYTVAAANHADETLSGANAPPSGTQKRYTVGIECSAGQTRRDILTELLSALGIGQLSYVHGTWRIYAGAYDAPVHAFTEADLYGEMEIQDTSSASDRFNKVCGTYIDAAQLYQAATTIYRTNAAYIVQDNGESIQKTLPLRGVTDNYRAQRIVEQALRSSRLMRSVKFRFRRGGMKVATWETFTMSHKRYGWVNRTFRCVERQLEYQSDGGVVVAITGKLEDSGVYTDLLTGDYTTGTSVTSAIQQEKPDAPLSLTTTTLGGQNIRFDWTLPPFWQLNGISEIWEYTANTPFSSATKIWQGRATSAVVTRSDTATRYYWVRVRAVGNQVSDPFPSGNGVAGAAGLVDTSMIAGLAVSQTVIAIGSISQFDGKAADGVRSVSDTLNQLSASITTTGGPVGLRITSCYRAKSTFGTIYSVLLRVKRDGSYLAGNVGQFVDNSGINMSQFAPVTIVAVDSPPAGTHTYTFLGTFDAMGTAGGITSPTLRVGDEFNSVPTTMELREYKR